MCSLGRFFGGFFVTTSILCFPETKCWLIRCLCIIGRFFLSLEFVAWSKSILIYYLTSSFLAYYFFRSLVVIIISSDLHWPLSLYILRARKLNQFLRAFFYIGPYTFVKIILKVSPFAISLLGLSLKKYSKVNYSISLCIINFTPLYFSLIFFYTDIHPGQGSRRYGTKSK